jgi:hypothetical protein
LDLEQREVRYSIVSVFISAQIIKSDIHVLQNEQIDQLPDHERRESRSPDHGHCAPEYDLGSFLRSPPDVRWTEIRF